MRAGNTRTETRGGPAPSRRLVHRLSAVRVAPEDDLAGQRMGRTTMKKPILPVLGAIGLVALGAMVGGATSALTSPEFDTVTVRRINVVDDDGTLRFALFNENTVPPAEIRGQTYDRSIGNVAGIAFFRPDGREAGGMLTADVENGPAQSAFIFDYLRQPTDGVSIGMAEGPDDESYRAGLSIADRRTYRPGPIESTQGTPRIALENVSGDARLVISDTQGRPRIRIGVTSDDRAEISILDAEGEVIRSVTERTEAY